MDTSSDPSLSARHWHSFNMRRAGTPFDRGQRNSSCSSANSQPRRSLKLVLVEKARCLGCSDPRMPIERLDSDVGNHRVRAPSPRVVRRAA